MYVTSANKAVFYIDVDDGDDDWWFTCKTNLANLFKPIEKML